MAVRFHLLAILILVSSIGIFDGNADVPEGLKPLRSVSNVARNVNCDTEKRLGCADCSTVQVCQWNGNPIESSKYRCDSVDRTKPYCLDNSGVCSDQPSASCVKPSDLCPATGIFPQPTNCREFIYCDDAKNAGVYSCPTNQVYNHAQQGCVPIRTSRDCFQLNCATAGSQNQWYVYTPAPHLYVFCSSVVGPMTFQCEVETEAFNQRLKRCDFGCPSVGRFAIPGEPDGSQRYYQCTLGAGNVLQYSVQRCPGVLVFSVTQLRCVAPTAS